MISGDLGYVGKERLQEIREDIGDMERMLNAMIKSLENKYLVEDPVDFHGEPLNPGPLGSLFPNIVTQLEPRSRTS